VQGSSRGAGGISFVLQPASALVSQYHPKYGNLELIKKRAGRNSIKVFILLSQIAIFHD
jgi:hypothetical protein